MKKLTLKSRWHEILGNNRAEMPDNIRIKRWEQWKKLAVQSGKQGKEMVEYWSEVNETCYSCKFRNADWCKSEELPCNINPVLTFRNGIAGMACRGIGYEARKLILQY